MEKNEIIEKQKIEIAELKAKLEERELDKGMEKQGRKFVMNKGDISLSAERVIK